MVESANKGRTPLHYSIELTLKGEPPVLKKIVFLEPGRSYPPANCHRDGALTNAIGVILTKYRTRQQPSLFRVHTKKEDGGFVRTIRNAKNDLQDKSSVHSLGDGKFLQLFLNPTGTRKDYVDVNVEELQPDDIIIVHDGDLVDDRSQLEKLAKSIATKAGWELADYRFESKNRPPPHNLPSKPEFFVGYDKLRQDIKTKLAGSGMIVLHDIGGVGKTTLAKQVAHNALREDLAPGGLVWIDCEPQPSYRTALQTIASVLLGGIGGLRDDAQLRDILLDQLSRHHAALIFDNFETVLHDDELNRFVHDASRSCFVLITTRQIHSGMEPKVVKLDALDTTDAVQLFCHEARMETSLQLKLNQIHQVCEMVGCLPLAIILAGRQARIISPSQIITELGKSLALLATNDQYLDGRHRSITACMLHSFELLNATQREILFHFSVPTYPIHRQFVEGYLGPLGVPVDLAACLHSGMLRLERDRYLLHPLVREFLKTQMSPKRMQEIATHFVTFFCGILDSKSGAPLNQDDRELIRTGLHSFEEALSWAGDFEQFDLLIKEYYPLRSYEYPDPGTVFGEEASWERRGQQRNYHEETQNLINQVRVSNNEVFQGRVLNILWRDNTINPRLLVRLHIALDPVRGRALYLDRLAEHASYNSASIAEALYEAMYSPELYDVPALGIEYEKWNKRRTNLLRHANKHWERVKDTYREDYEANLINLILYSGRTKDPKETMRLSLELWDVMALSTYCVNDITGCRPWYRSEGRALSSCADSAEDRYERFIEVAGKIAEILITHKACRAAMPWINELIKSYVTKKNYSYAGHWASKWLELLTQERKSSKSSAQPILPEMKELSAIAQSILKPGKSTSKNRRRTRTG